MYSEKQRAAQKRYRHSEKGKRYMKKYNKEYYQKNKKKEQLRHYKNKIYYGTYAKVHYQNNKDKYKGYHRKQQIKNRGIMEQLKINGCAICGYDKCNRALDFHHVNPEEKILPICLSKLNYADKTLIKELNKCILLCKNCHYEIESLNTVGDKLGVV